MKKPLAYLVASCFVFNLSAYSQEAAPFTKTIEKMKQSVVPIVCFVNQKETSQPHLISVEGTGFFVSGDPRVITAGHVAKGLTSAGRIPACPTPAIYLPFDGWNSSSTKIEYVPITSCATGDSLDIGACDLLQDPQTINLITVKPKGSALDDSIYSDGTPVAFMGFPLSFVKPITSQGIVGAYKDPSPIFGPTALVIDKNAWPGASGSPVFESGGSIIGMVVQRGFNDASGLAFAIPGHVLKRFLADNPPKKADTAQPPKKP
jgi:S1-C subfamily serine protease